MVRIHIIAIQVILGCFDTMGIEEQPSAFFGFIGLLGVVWVVVFSLNLFDGVAIVFAGCCNCSMCTLAITSQIRSNDLPYDCLVHKWLWRVARANKPCISSKK